MGTLFTDLTVSKILMIYAVSVTSNPTETKHSNSNSNLTPFFNTALLSLEKEKCFEVVTFNLLQASDDTLKTLFIDYIYRVYL